ncbi:hypothetical protein [Sphingomonas sp. Marseille-Q8236]
MLLTLLIASTLSTAASGREPIAPTIAAPSTAAMTSGGSAASTFPADTRFCIYDTPTGSRIRLKVCRTADEWIATEGQVPTGRIARR